MRRKGNILKLRNIYKERFGRLIAIVCIHRVGLPTHWRCICDCGRKVEVSLTSLASGSTKSCGCLKRELAYLRFKPQRFIEHEGITHHVAEWGRVLSIIPATITTRLRLGWSIGQALGLEDPPERGLLLGGNVFEPKMETFEGVTKSVRAFAEDYGLKPTLVLSRLRSGWTMAEALGLERHVTRRTRFENRVVSDQYDLPHTSDWPRKEPTEKWV